MARDRRGKWCGTKLLQVDMIIVIEVVEHSAINYSLDIIKDQEKYKVFCCVFNQDVWDFRIDLFMNSAFSF